MMKRSWLAALMPWHPGQPNGFRGFSLLELMIVLLLITVLAAMAMPSYQQYVQRSHRMAAIDVLLSASSCQQRIYASSFHYDTRSCLPGNPGDRYNYRIEPPNTASTTIFKVIASPMGSQQQDVCEELSLDQSGWRDISGAEELRRKCWEGR